jgi:hypothetical protein
MTSNPNSPDFNYKKYSLEKLQEWVHDAMNSDASPQEIYFAIREAVREDYYYHKDYISRAGELLALLNDNGEGHLSCDKDDKSPECQQAWNSFWEEYYYPEEVKTDGYSVNELSHQEIEAIREAGGYEWTPDPEVSRNDPTRLKYEEGWIYESPDGGKTVTKRKIGSDEKLVVKQDKVKKWVLPVEECKDADTDETEYFVSFPEDLLESADLKEGDQVEWVDKGDGSYLLRKVTRPLGMDEC